MKKSVLIILSAMAAFLVSCKEETMAPLQADFTHSASSVMVGDEVSFKDVSLGSPSRWTWTFEGAETETSVLSQPVVRWMKAGTFTVSLKVANSETESEIVKEKLITVEWHKTVTADFEFDKEMLFDNEFITFTNKSTGFPSEIKWTFTPDQGTPVTSTEDSPKLQLKPGVYAVKLEVSNPLSSDVKEVANAFTVLDQYAVMADFTAKNATTYEGGNVNFVSTSTGNVQNIEWTFEGGTPATSNEANPVVTYSAPGTYKVALKTWNEKYDDTKVKEGFVTVVPTFNSMVFLLPFDNDAKDYGPYNIQPELYQKGGLEPSYVEGHTGETAMQFPGGEKGKSYSVLLMPEKELTTVYPQGSEMTLSVWYKLGAVSANNAIFAQGHCPGFPMSQQIWGRFQTGNKFRVTAEVTTPKVSITTQPVNEHFYDGEWHHLAVTSAVNEGIQTVTIYLDGVSQGSAKGTGNVDQMTWPYCIGANLRWTNDAPAPENMFTGIMDDYILYNKALTVDQIKQLGTL